MGAPWLARWSRSTLWIGGILLFLAWTARLVPDVRLRASSPTDGPLRLRPCHVDRLPEEVLCGVHEVYEDRDAATGRRIPVHVAVLPALRRAAQPDPLFMLAGGPGQGARGLAVLAARALHRVRRTRDVVLVDLRGTGASGALTCPPEADDLGTLGGLLLAPDAVRHCLASFDADVRRYGHRDALADLDEVRRRLGYARVNLWGGSFGTRAALQYASGHPQAVRSLVLDGAAPEALRFPLSTARDGQRALDLLVEDCTADAACHAAFPRFADDLRDVLDRAARGAIDGTIRHPRTGSPARIRLTYDALVEGLRVALYTTTDVSLLPAIVGRLRDGDAGPFYALLLRASRWSIDTMALGVTLSIVCSEDVSRIRDEEIDPATRGTVAGRRHVDALRRACVEWPAEGPPRPTETTRLPGPALVLSGRLDPVTPPHWGETLARRFDESLHVTVPAAAHNASFGGCVPDLIADFLERGTTAGLDTACAGAAGRPRFVVSHAGPTP